MRTFLILILALLSSVSLAQTQSPPAGLRVESLESPEGIDAVRPRLSWELRAEARTPNRGLGQTAYQIMVASSRGELEAGHADLWDSGKVVSAQNLYVPYGGKPLGSNQRCWWKVRYWDEARAPGGEASAWSAPATWLTGLLSPLSEWRAEWIGLDDLPEGFPWDATIPEKIIDLKETHGAASARLADSPWIMGPGPVADFYKEFTIDRARLKSAAIAVHADAARTSCGQLFVNGRELLQFGYGFPRALEITDWLRDGSNSIAVRKVPRLTALLRLEDRTGSVTLIRTDASWKTCPGPLDLWDEAAMARAEWMPVRVLGARDKPAAEIKPQGLTPPAVRLRGEFTLKAPVRQAVLHATALGLYDVYLNGKRVGRSLPPEVTLAVGEGRLQPGWTQYNRRITLVTDDVTSLVRAGANAMGAELAEGWFSGHAAWFGRNPDAHPRFAAQLHIEYADGTQEVIATGPGWRACLGPTRQADLMMGETYDARLEQPGWTESGFDDRDWKGAVRGSPVVDNGTPKFVDLTARLATEARKAGSLTVVVTNELGGDPAPGDTKQLIVNYTLNGDARTVTVDEGQILVLPDPSDSPGGLVRIQRALYGRFQPLQLPPCTFAARACPPVRVSREIPPVRITQPRPGVWVFDFGEQLTGWTKLTTRNSQLTFHNSQPATRRIMIRYAEALRPDGTLDTTNLRSISPADTYIACGDGAETWEPRFTFHGFRYAQVLGLDAPPTTATLTAITAGSGGPVTSAFHCSSETINQLYAAIVRTQQANFLEVPLDGPGHDQRLGLSGDFAAFLATARYNQRGVDAFAWKYLLDLLDRQIADGSAQHGNVGAFAPVPNQMGAAGPARLDHGIVTMLIPWNLLQFYGDTERVRQVWPALERYMGFLEQALRHLSDNPADGDAAMPLGDYLPPAPPTPPVVIARALATMACDKMATLAGRCGHSGSAAHWRDFAESLRVEFVRRHIKPDGTVEGDTQTAYALAVRYILKSASSLSERVAGQFVRRVERDGFLPRVGYLGAGELLPALTAIGRADLACRVIQATGEGSWGAMVGSGATTIWETWRPGTQDALNRTPLGACGEWLFADLLGLQPLEPGFKKVRVRPAVGSGLDFAEGSFATVYGRLSAGWKVAPASSLQSNGRHDARATLRVSVPPNTTAEIWLAGADAERVTESGVPASKAEGIRVVGGREGCAVFETGSGDYVFEWPR